MIYKKAAMFGLDARIALAIFGALSVISGAALYSAIQSANAEKWRQYFEGIVKASEQYYLDNGQQLPKTTVIRGLYSSDLVYNREGLATWNGPYIDFSSQYYTESFSVFRDSFTKTFDNSTAIEILLLKRDTWADTNLLITDDCVVNDYNCSEWIAISGGSTTYIPIKQALFTNLDKLVDNSDGPLSGKVRYKDYSSDYVFYQGIPHKRTN